MTRFERWFFRRVCRRLVVQGPHHAQNISDLYRIVQDAAVDEFTEDNILTTEEFLRERQQAAFEQRRKEVLGYWGQDAT